MKFTAPAQVKVLDALRQLFPDSSRRTLQNWLAGGRFSIDGKTIRHENILLEEGQTLSTLEHFRPQKISGLKIIFEDRYLIAIDKPVGLLSVPLDDSSSKRHALGLLRLHYMTDQIYAVHRIDRETSGALLFARGKESEERLKDLFEKHDLKREYLAIVEGRMAQDKGTWESNLIELPNLSVVESPEGKTAITHYEVLRRSPKYTYLRLILETGRKHQIRVHCQSAGHPVVGDMRYGSTHNPMERLCLHARFLSLVHPFTKKPLSFSSPLPKIFQVLGGQWSDRERA
ncbi:MAG: RluA family pseudouridine synthase [Verrucomicrobia bacterium]|nr:RluA family pseudouridine synthase [Verrucomicrobiota bacterium]